MTVRLSNGAAEGEEQTEAAADAAQGLCAVAGK